MQNICMEAIILSKDNTLETLDILEIIKTLLVSFNTFSSFFNA